MTGRNKEIKYGTDKHKKIVGAVEDRRKYSQREMQDRHKKWRMSEERFISYIPKSEEDKLREQKKEDGKPQFVTLDIPYSYAILMSAHTYWASVFLGRDPIFQYTGRHGEPMQQTQAVEALIDYQIQAGENLPPLYIWLLDVGKYGVGIIGDFWEEQFSKIVRMEERQQTYLGVPIPGGKKKQVKVTQKAKTYQGNKLFNVRPYDFLNDPRVPISKFQTGEFCGRVFKLGMHEIEAGKEDGKYFNVEQLKKVWSGRAKDFNAENEGDSDPGSDQILMPAEYTPDFTEKGKKGQVSCTEMVVKIIPKEWGLGEGSYPEKWVFTVADGEVLIGCEPLGAYHDRFPYSILTLEMDGYSLYSRSMMEILEPLQDTMNWLFNTHFHNVRKALNDQFVIDPSRVVMKDATNPGPGKMIRTKPSAYGEDIRTMIQQLPVTDVTQQHIADAQQMGSLMQRVSGVNDAVMGVMDTGGRQTATQVRTTTGGSVNRMKTVAEWFSALGFAPLSQMMLSNTQQYYDGEMKLKIAGSLWSIKNAEEGLTVSPEDIMGFYDFVPVDGTMPVDRFAQANLWKEIMQMMMDLGLNKNYDMPSILGYVAQISGIKNIGQFKVNVRSDAEIMELLEKGEISPANPRIEEILNGAGQRTGTTGGGASGQGSSPEGSGGDDERSAQEGQARAPNTGEVGGVGPAG